MSATCAVDGEGTIEKKTICAAKPTQCSRRVASISKAASASDVGLSELCESVQDSAPPVDREVGPEPGALARSPRQTRLPASCPAAAGIGDGCALATSSCATRRRLQMAVARFDDCDGEGGARGGGRNQSEW